MEALGGVLNCAYPNGAHIQHRLSKGEACFYRYARQLRSKQPVELKLRAFAAAPRAAGTFLLSIAHWNKTSLSAAARWERRLLTKCFRFRPKPDEGRMQFNRRVAARLRNWMGYFKYKPIVTHILERVYLQVWHERTTAVSLQRVRVDRGAEIWAFMREVGSRKRAREGCGVHARPGAHLSFDALFVSVYGLGWRRRLQDCSDVTAWRAGCRQFVRDVCKLHALGDPYPGGEPTFIPKEINSEAAAGISDDVEMPRQLKWDTLWTVNAPC